jgi:multiple sugar transport system ATP-binding protein
VIHTEILGSDTYVYIDLGLEEPLVVRESGVAVRKSGETLSVSPAGDNVHRFDEKGRAV